VGIAGDRGEFWFGFLGTILENPYDFHGILLRFGMLTELIESEFGVAFVEFVELAMEKVEDAGGGNADVVVCILPTEFLPEK
jgi:hypothetical protein